MERCHDIRELPDLARLPADDPRRRHLAVCPRCRGEAEALALFLEPGETSELDDLAEADAQLQRRLAKAWTAPVPVAPAGRRRRRWYGLAAALAICALGLTTAELWRLRATAPLRVGERLRGAPEAAGLTVTVLDTGWKVFWFAAAPADTIVLRWLGSELETVGVVVAPRPEFTVPIPEQSADIAFCQAFAVSQGDTLDRSAIVRVRPDRE